MTVSLAIVLAFLVAAVAMFAVNRPRMDVVAVIMLTLLPFTGVLTMGEALAGFADPNVVLIAALFVVGDGLVRTGVARKLGDWLIATAGASEARLIVLLMIVVCGLGSFMSSTAVTAIFIPVALRISQASGIAPGKLMMPLSFAALISGMMTLVATAPNLVVDAELIRHSGVGLSFFAFTPIGVPVLVVGIVYMLFARRFLPSGDADGSERARGVPQLRDWIDEYGLRRRERRLRIGPESSLVGRPFADFEEALSPDLDVLAIERREARRFGPPVERLTQPSSALTLRIGDVLYLDDGTGSSAADELRDRFGLEDLPLVGAYFGERAQEIGMAEAMIPAHSELLDRSIRDVRFRRRYGLTAIGLKRGRKPVESNLVDEPLRVGDTLLLVGPWKALEELRMTTRDLAPLDLPAEADEILPAPGKAIFAVLSLVIVVVLMATGIVPNVQAALLGCLLMGATGCIDVASAYRSIDWKTIVLIVGMLPFSLALQRTGGDQLAADALTAVTSSMGSYGTLGCLFIVTAVLGLFISNTATAVLMAPVALAVADELGASPFPFAMIVALAASTAFMTPVSSPVNTLVVSPGGYRFADFLKIGVPFSLIVLVISVVLVVWWMPL